MKNPFKDPIKPIHTSLWGWQLDFGSLTTVGADREQKAMEYAAHAINRHDKLVEMLRMLEFDNKCYQHTEMYQCPVCHEYPGRLGHMPDCELAVLLAEEGRE